MNSEQEIGNRSKTLPFWVACLFAFFLLFAFCFLPFASSVAFAKKYTAKSQQKYQYRVLKQEAKDDYQRSLLPQSGAMTTEEYENLSQDIPNSKKKIPPYEMPKDSNMKYVPHPTYKVVLYNDPPGSAEIHLLRKFFFNRQINGTAITSPNKDIMVYPVVYYYAVGQCTAGELFVIPLDSGLGDVDRISRANVVKRNPVPILSTEKDINVKGTFRTMTPVDFSADGSKLLAKEKIGNNNDGIWQTNLWVYDFNTKKAKELSEIREAIKFYWKNVKKLNLDEKRWDISPLGFDANNPDRVVVSAYGYTGRAPQFLGNWSIDCEGQTSMLVSLFRTNADISVNGYKLVQAGVIPPDVLKKDEKKQNKIIKKNKKKDKKAKKLEKKKKKAEYKKRLHELKSQQGQIMRNMQGSPKSNGPTGLE